MKRDMEGINTLAAFPAGSAFLGGMFVIYFISFYN